MDPLEPHDRDAPATPARHARPRRAGVAAWVVAMVAVGALAFSAAYAGTVVERLDSTLGANAQDVTEIVGTARPVVSHDPEDPDAGKALNILLMGSDTRAGDDNQALGGGDVAGMRNDTTILVHIAGDRSRIDAVSIPRDAQVEIPECRLLDGSTVPAASGDFNIAFANGGQRGNAGEAAACTIRAVEELTGVFIHHWMVVDFAGFIGMVDALGGVPMCIPERIVSEKAHLDLEPGPQVLDGETALGFARLRTAEVGDVSGSDLQRITRQQLLLSQVARTVVSKNLLTDTGELTRFVRAAAESVAMDTELADVPFLVGLAFALRGIDPDAIEFTTAPWAYTEDRLNVELTDDAAQVWDDMRSDRPLSVTAEGDASSEWDDGRTASTATADAEDADASTATEGARPSPSSPASSPTPHVTSPVEELLNECR
ncbi:LCP family protein [Demequina pelophila]|uniref:LCP family protein n=1 Tax=Demequina pelophila TaxID=1638984 RepID=UPI000781C414|nr:LCP family protein [Demequina pelophila]